MRVVGLEQGVGRGGAVDTFAVGGINHCYCFGVECAVVTGAGFARQVRCGDVVVELPCVQADFDDAVPGLAKHGALTAFRSGSSFFRPFTFVDILPEEEQAPQRSGYGQHQYRGPVVGPVDNRSAVFCGQLGIVGHSPIDILRGEKLKEGLPVTRVDVSVGDDMGVP